MLFFFFKISNNIADLSGLGPGPMAPLLLDPGPVGGLDFREAAPPVCSAATASPAKEDISALAVLHTASALYPTPPSQPFWLFLRREIYLCNEHK